MDYFVDPMSKRRGNLLSTLLIVVGGHQPEKLQENLENGLKNIPYKMLHSVPNATIFVQLRLFFKKLTSNKFYQKLDI